MLYDYTQNSQEELSVSRGLVISLLEKNDPDWWFVKDGPTREGYVPANYLKLLWDSVGILGIAKYFIFQVFKSASLETLEVRIEIV